MDVKTSPLVAIRCITYNHEPYIRDALEGFVMQKTNFPFVAIVHDDASTDGTADIIREYAAKYPDIIKPIYETENQYSRRDGSLSRIMNEACAKTGAKYYALCEGDDYWTDPLKLQKQVDFLESHPECSYLFTDARLHYETGLSDYTYHVENREYSRYELYNRWLVPTPTVVYRQEVLHSDCFKILSNIKKPLFGDLSLCMAASTIGKIYGMNEVMCGYRRLSSGATSTLRRDLYGYMKNHLCISKYFGNKYVEIDKIRFQQFFIPSIKHPFKKGTTHLKYICRYFWLAPGRCIKLLSKGLI